MNKDVWDEQTSPGVAAVQAGTPTWLKQYDQPKPGAILTVGHRAEAGRAGLVSASNAAADGAPRATQAGRSVLERAPVDREPFQLLWQDRDAVRGVAPGSTAVAKEPDAGWVGPNDKGGALPHNGAARLLGSGPFSEIGELGAALAHSVKDTGEVAPTFTVLKGALVLTLDEAERLRAMTATLEPLSPVDKRMADAVAHAKDVAARKLASRESIDIATRRLLDAHHALSRPNTELELAIDRALLLARAFQHRDVLGAEHVRAAFTQGPRSAPAYLTSECAARLPLMQRLGVVILAEVLPTQDDTEPSPLCLRVLAIGRTLSLRV